MQGTVKQLIDNGLKVNGKFVDQSMLSVLIRLGIGEEIGEEPKPPNQKGRAAKIYKFENSHQLKFEFS